MWFNGALKIFLLGYVSQVWWMVAWNVCMHGDSLLSVSVRGVHVVFSNFVFQGGWRLCPNEIATSGGECVFTADMARLTIPRDVGFNFFINCVVATLSVLSTLCSGLYGDYTWFNFFNNFWIVQCQHFLFFLHYFLGCTATTLDQAFVSSQTLTLWVTKRPSSLYHT